MTSIRNRWAALGVLSVVGLVIGLDTTVLNVALPTLAADLHATTTQLQWFADSYLLALAALLLPGGLVGDRLGRKALTLISLAVFGAGSLWSAYAISPEALIAARAVMGIGAAFLTPLAFAWLVVLFDEAERPKALGALGGAAFLGLPLGPLVAGWLLDNFFWGSVFLINLPLIVIALGGAAVLLPGGGRVPRDIDAIGILLSVTGLAGLTYGLIEAPIRGWSDPLVLTMWLGGLVVLIGFLVWQGRRGRRALMDLAVWRLTTFSWGTSVLVVATMLGMVAMFSAPIYFQAVLGVDALGSGVRLIPMIVGILIGVIFSVAVSQKASYKAAILVGLLMIAFASALATRTTVDSGYGSTAIWLAAFGFGFGAIMIGAQNLALNKLDETLAGIGSATVQVMRQTGSVVGIAVLISLLNSVYRQTVDVTALPPQAAAVVKDSVQAGLGVAAKLNSPELALAVKNAYLDGMHAQMWIGAAMASLAAAVVVLVMPRDLGRVTPEGSNHDPNQQLQHTTS